MTTWEYFIDEAYYHTWCVRKVGSTNFNDPESFHLMYANDAERLCGYLNSLENFIVELQETPNDT